jgi:hypothetical protein
MGLEWGVPGLAERDERKRSEWFWNVDISDWAKFFEMRP